MSQSHECQRAGFCKKKNGLEVAEGSEEDIYLNSGSWLPGLWEKRQPLRVTGKVSSENLFQRNSCENVFQRRGCDMEKFQEGTEGGLDQVRALMENVW